MQWTCSILLAAFLLHSDPHPAAARENPRFAHSSSESRMMRSTAQFTAGTLVGSTAGLLTVALGASMVLCDDCNSGDPEYGTTGWGWTTILIGAPAALVLSNSAVVYFIGKEYDRENHGSYLATLGGALAGAALTVGTTALLYDSGMDGEDLTLPTTVMALALPTAGAILGYNRSKKNRPP